MSKVPQQQNGEAGDVWRQDGILSFGSSAGCGVNVFYIKNAPSYYFFFSLVILKTLQGLKPIFNGF